MTARLDRKTALRAAVSLCLGVYAASNARAVQAAPLDGALLGQTPTAAPSEVPPPPPPPPPVVEAPPATTPAVTSPAAAAAPVEPLAAPASADANLDAEAAKYAADLLSQTGGGGDAAKDFSPSLRFYGFADFMIQKWMFLNDQQKGVLNDSLSFGVSHLNLYAEGDISPSWKSMAEVRFMFQPSGAQHTGTTDVSNPLSNSGRVDSATRDYNDSSRPVNLGGLAIQRAYIEYAASAYVKIRAGRFLTPWGIWNVDHGSPVIIGPNKPYVIGEQFFPEAQTGFEALGTVPIGDITLGYHLTLSNGRGPADAYEDVDNNKALGGRLFVRGYWLGQLDIGVSGYGGTVSDRRQMYDLVNKKVEWFNYSRYREVAWAADIKWLWKGLHFQTEGAIHDRAWDDGARPPLDGGYQPDVRRIGLYSLLGYRLPWLNVMPYFIFSYYDAGNPDTLGGAKKILAYSGGLNVRVTPAVVFKTEIGKGYFREIVPGSFASGGHSLGSWLTQIAWAF